MNSKYILYRAKVTGVSQPSLDGEVRRVIYVSPINNLNVGDVRKKADPPTPLPTSNLGAGMLSVPALGQECLVAESDTDRIIVSYMQPRGLSPYGVQIPEYIGEGDTLLKATGLDPVELRLSREGVARLYGNEFSQVGIDAAEQRFFLKGREGKIDYNAGQIEFFYNRDTNSSGARHVYTAHKDVSGFSDLHLRPEQGPSAVYPVTEFTYRYPDKAVLYLGDRSTSGAPFHFNTIQSINPKHPQDKTVITDFRLGYQKSHTRFGETQFSAGNLLEFTGKKNFAGNVETVTLKIGNSGDSELYRLHLNSDLNNNIPFGQSIINPLGEGSGYFFTDAPLPSGFSYFERVTKNNESFYLKSLKTTNFWHKTEFASEIWQKTTIESQTSQYSKEITSEFIKETHSNGLVREFTENKAFTSIKSGTFSELKESSAIIRTDKKASLTLEGDKVTLGNDKEDLVKILRDVILTLSTTISPGYGAPISSAPQFSGELLTRIQSILKE